MSSVPALTLIGLTVAAALGSFLAADLAARKTLLPDIPKDRSNHTVTSSRAGGVAIIAAVILVMMIAVVTGHSDVPAIALVAAAAAILGLLDDRADLSARLKFVALLVLCCFAALVMGPITELPLPAGGYMGIPLVAGYAVTALFLFGFINMFNFMDGLNGIAGGSAMIGLLILTLLAGPDAGALPFWLIVAAAIYGFLIPNIRARRVFLGDSGSLSLGMLLGASATGISQREPEAVFILCIAFMPFIADVAATLFLRARRGENVMDAHRDHFYQRIRRAGWSHQAVAGAYVAMVASAGIGAYFLEAMAGSIGLWIAGIAALCLTALVWRAMFAMVEVRTGARPS